MKLITVHQFNSYNGAWMRSERFATEEQAIAAARQWKASIDSRGMGAHIRITRTPKIIMNSKLPH